MSLRVFTGDNSMRLRQYIPKNVLSKIILRFIQASGSYVSKITDCGLDNRDFIC